MTQVRVGRQVATEVRVSRANYLRLLDIDCYVAVMPAQVYGGCDPLAVIRTAELPTKGRQPRPKKESLS